MSCSQSFNKDTLEKRVLLYPVFNELFVLEMVLQISDWPLWLGSLCLASLCTYILRNRYLFPHIAQHSPACIVTESLKSW